MYVKNLKVESTWFTKTNIFYKDEKTGAAVNIIFGIKIHWFSKVF